MTGRACLTLIVLVAALLGAPPPVFASHHQASEPSVAAAVGPSSDPSRAEGADDVMLLPILLGGLCGVAALTIVGVAIRINGRRRRGGGGRNGGEAGKGAEAAATALERRTLRRARLRLDEDPIVAAMGIGTTPRRLPRRPANRSSVGLAERELPRR